MIRILLVDDHAVVRYGLRYMLNYYPDMQVVGEGENGQQAVEMVSELLPDIVLLDVIMEQMDGITAIREIKRISPHTHIIIVTSFYEDDYIFKAIKSGAISYLLKESSTQELIDAIYAATRGESKLHPRVAARLLRELRQPNVFPLKDLSPRETEVLSWIARGRSNQEIAGELSIAEATVRMHIANILSKLHLADRTQAAIYALQKNLVPLENALDSERNR